MKFKQMHRNFINLSTCIAMIPVVLEPTKIYNMVKIQLNILIMFPPNQTVIFFTVNLSFLLFNTEFIHNPM